MYSTRSGLILGFHGCDKWVADKVISTGEDLYPSKNIYDWLGKGIYFWEYDSKRALEYAHELKNDPPKGKEPIQEPTVVGAVLDLGMCLDLVNTDKLELLKTTYDTIVESFKLIGKAVPKNKKGKNINSPDLLRRELDCLIINTVHEQRQDQNLPPFDSVRGVFWEGEELYDTAGFRAKNHIQIAIRNPNCIKGYFRPKSLDTNHSPV